MRGIRSGWSPAAGAAAVLLLFALFFRGEATKDTKISHKGHKEPQRT